MRILTFTECGMIFGGGPPGTPTGGGDNPVVRNPPGNPPGRTPDQIYQELQEFKNQYEKDKKGEKKEEDCRQDAREKGMVFGAGFAIGFTVGTSPFSAGTTLLALGPATFAGVTAGDFLGDKFGDLYCPVN